MKTIVETKRGLEVDARDRESCFDALVAEYERIKRERDAAVEDLKMLAKCPTCKHYGTPCGTPNHPCEDCHPIERQRYVWRGVKEANDG